MKKLIALILIVFSTLILANGNVADYRIQKGKLHSGGKARAEVMESDAANFVVKLNYEIYKKILVPIPEDQLKGESIFELPADFRDERGYMELELKKEIVLEKAKLKFISRVKVKNSTDAYKVQILPNNGRSKIEALYHPNVPAAGWSNIVITFINNIPVFNGYQVIIDINE